VEDTLLYPQRVLRIFHTADWHLGQTLRGYSRDLEQASVLNSLIDQVRHLQPHAVIVSGDVYDSPNPSADAHRLLYKTLVEIHRASPQTTTILTAGNHDAASRIEAPRDLLAAFNVHVVGNIRRQQDQTSADHHLIPITSEGQTLAHVLAVSYPTAACLPAASSLIDSVRTLYAGLVEQTRSIWQGLPLILTGHLHVSGATTSEGAERSILIGGENAFPANHFPTEAAYIALGHLHKPQRIGADHIRYSGSLLPLSASEIDYKHGVTCVEINNQTVTTQHIEIPRPIPFHRIPHKGVAQFDDIPVAIAALKIDKASNPHQRPFAQIRLSRTGLPATFREDLDQLAESAGLRLVDTRVEDLTTTNSAAATPTTTIADHDPAHFFNLAFERTHNLTPSPAHRTIFDQAHEEAQQ
jgi:exonuclease SbcD